MKVLNTLETSYVSGAGAKQDAGIYTLGVSGATLVFNGLCMTGAGIASGNKTLIKAGVVTTGFGAAILGAVAAAESTGYSDLQGWYQLAKNIEYYKGYLPELPYFSS